MSVRPWHLPSTPVNILCTHETFRQLLSTIRSAGGPPVNFCQLIMRPRDSPPTFCALVGTFVNLRRLLVLMVDIPSI